MATVTSAFRIFPSGAFSHEHGGLGKAAGWFSGVQRNELLTGPGKISAEQAKLHAETEYEKYRVIQDRLYESDFDRFLMLEQEVNHKDEV